jgi:hypothetical protein
MKMKRHNAEAVLIRVEAGNIVVYAPGDDPLYFDCETTLHAIMKAVTRSRYE